MNPDPKVTITYRPDPTRRALLERLLASVRKPTPTPKEKEKAT